MCSGGKAPAVQKPGEPLKNVDASMSRASGDTARAQMLQKGLASIWTRNFSGDGSSDGVKADRLGG